MADARPKSFNERVIEDFRSHDGQITSGPFTGRSLLLLTTKGAKTGDDRTSPLAYSRDGDRLVIIASKGGAPTNPQWFYNVKANPEVEIELGTETIPVRARIATGDERERIWSKQKQLMPGFASYEKKTSREIPVIVLERR